ncbi:MAG: hypothetical protein IT370_20600 [Deltaproteobacteria bacterium]|nr:hypothetical protein [Deltaproteobacteria bacterium]
MSLRIGTWWMEFCDARGCRRRDYLRHFNDPQSLGWIESTQMMMRLEVAATFGLTAVAGATALQARWRVLTRAWPLVVACVGAAGLGVPLVWMPRKQGLTFSPLNDGCWTLLLGAVLGCAAAVTLAARQRALRGDATLAPAVAPGATVASPAPAPPIATAHLGSAPAPTSCSRCGSSLRLIEGRAQPWCDLCQAFCDDKHA